jgi:phosphatidate cytidylyltransferase
MLKARVITALILVAMLAAILFAAPPIVVVIAFSLIAALAAWEWGGLMRQEPPARWLFALLTLFFCWQMYLIAENVFPLLFIASLVLWLLIMPLWLYQRWTLAGNDFVGYFVGLLVILPTWAAMVSLQAVSSWLLLAAMAVVWVADVAAYFSGRAFGRRKLAPQISPGKTWEGVLGAVIGVIVYGSLVVSLTPLGGFVHLSPIGLAGLLILLTALSVVGDLFESLLKRHAQIKDSSQLLPGHGGILDRIDSLTSTLPFVAALVILWQR